MAEKLGAANVELPRIQNEDIPVDMFLTTASHTQWHQESL